jgi:choline dehydrogenase-like flavoprotein
MIIDARGIPQGTAIDADLCIVGAGAAGIALAKQFVGTGTRVCLLESGGLTADWETQSLVKGESVGLPYSEIDTFQIRCFGGNTNAWGGWCRALDESDFERRPWVEHSGWPFGHAELAPYYRAAHEVFQVDNTDYDVQAAVDALADPNARLIPFDGAKLESALYRFSPPTRFGQVYRDLVQKAEGVRCLTNATVLGIKTSDDAQTATRVAVGSLGGGRFEVTAKVFVLAAGAVENARLLLLSNEVAAGGLGNRYDLVGRYFMDHPHTKRVLLADSRTPAFGLYGLGFRNRGICAGISLPAAVQERAALLNYKASIYPVYAAQTSRGWIAFRNLVLSLSPGWKTDPYDRFSLPFARKQVSPRQFWDVLSRPDQVTMGAALQVLKPDRLVSSYILESKPEQAPNPDSRITLHHERDAFGLNGVRVDWRLLPLDGRTVVHAEALIEEELRRLGLGRLAPVPAEEREDRLATIVGGWHQIGTTRAHEDPRQGVVDAQCKVHGTSNLFIAGASVFPTGGAVSPTPTILALALRLGDHLKGAVLSGTRDGLSLRTQPSGATGGAGERQALRV